MNFALLHPQALDIQQKPCAYIAQRTKAMILFKYVSSCKSIHVFERRVMHLLWIYRGEIEAQILQLI